MKIEEILINQITNKNGTFDKPIIDISEIIGIIPYGSRVYDTDSENSDYDFVVIHTDETHINVELYSDDNLDIHYIYIDAYKHLLKHHDIMAMEVFYTMTQKEAIKSFDIEFDINLSTLRKSISSTSSNSFVKFKKKLTLEGENKYIGIKSLFHSIRIAQLGYSIAIKSRDVLYTDTYLWNRIKNDALEFNYSWEKLHEKYKPMLNEAMTEFRKSAPKE